MLVGTADLDQLAANAATVEKFVKEELVLPRVTCFQLIAEMRNSAREAVLPPSLHPTIPPALSVQVYAVEESPWGPFRFANARISCRSGVRARGFSTATMVDQDNACTALRGSLGFPARLAQIDFRHGYDGVNVQIRQDGQLIFAASGIDPEPMAHDDVQYTGTLNLAHTPLGLRLMQIEAHTEASQVERLSPQLQAFDGAAWGNVLLDPAYVVSGSVVKMSLTFPAVRFVCKPDELAFTGTEAVA